MPELMTSRTQRSAGRVGTAWNWGKFVQLFVSHTYHRIMQTFLQVHLPIVFEGWLTPIKRMGPGPLLLEGPS